MLLADIRDYIGTLGITDDEKVYSGMLPVKEEKSIGVYHQKPRPKTDSVGSNTSYGIKPVSILVHWSASQRETEKVSNELYEKLESCRNVIINDKKLKFTKLAHEEPIDVGIDANGVNHGDKMYKNHVKKMYNQPLINYHKFIGGIHMIGDKWLSIRNDKKKGLSYSEIARKYNIDRRTAKKYCVSNVKPDYKYRNPRKRKIDEYAPYIDELLAEAPYSAVRIQELVEEHFHTKIGYTTIQEYVKKTKTKYNHQATVRFETMPGLQGQVDWGFFENYTVTDVNGEEKKLYCFLMILGYSRMRYIEFVTDMSTQTLIKCHLNAFDYFGGYPDEILYDNMKQVVVKRLLKQKDSTLNRTFEDFAGFFNFKPVLCRPYRGQTKGKIERTVRYVRENFMIGIKYKDLEDLNKQAYVWCEKVNNKVHSTTNEIPKIRLIEEHLTKVTRPYFIDINSVRKVEKDCLFSYKGNKYSVPPKYIYRHVVVAGFDNLLQVYCDGEKIATHPIARGKNMAVINKYHYDSISHSKHDKDHNSIFDDANYDEKLSNVDLEVYNCD